MGLRTEITDISGGNSDIITIVGGKFTQRVEQGTNGAECRTLTKGKNEGKEVWELHFPALSGMLINVEITESNFGGCDGTITLHDFKTDDRFSIQTSADNGKFTDFLKCLPNIDTRKEVVLEMHPKKGGKVDSNGNPITNLKVIQGGRVVKNYYQEWDNAEQKYNCINGMPDWEKTPKGWNHDEQDYFLWEKCNVFFENYEPPTDDPDFHYGLMDADGAKETPPDETLDHGVQGDPLPDAVDDSDSIPF